MGGDDLRVLLFQHDEMMKNLFKKYLQKHQIFFNFATSFKDLLQTFKVRGLFYQFIINFQSKQYKACFIDIDVSIKSEDLDELVDVNESFRQQTPPYKCRIYCFHCNIKIFTDNFQQQEISTVRSLGFCRGITFTASRNLFKGISSVSI